jgi:hypothetical protein
MYPIPATRWVPHLEYIRTENPNPLLPSPSAAAPSSLILSISAAPPIQLRRLLTLPARDSGQPARLPTRDLDKASTAPCAPPRPGQRLSLREPPAMLPPLPAPHPSQAPEPPPPPCASLRPGRRSLRPNLGQGHRRRWTSKLGSCGSRRVKGSGHGVMDTAASRRPVGGGQAGVGDPVGTHYPHGWRVWGDLRPDTGCGCGWQVISTLVGWVCSCAPYQVFHPLPSLDGHT